MPVQGSKVVFDPSFQSDLNELRENYPEIDDAVKDLIEMLQLDYDLPEMTIDVGDHVYMMLIDYPPEGPDGLRQFSVVYHATDPHPSWTEPYRMFTLLTITDQP